MSAPTTMQSEAMRWGYLPLAGESGAHERADDDAERSDEEAMRRSGAHEHE